MPSSPRLPRTSRTARRLLLVAVGGVGLLGILWALLVEASLALAVVISLQGALAVGLLLVWRRLTSLGTSQRAAVQELRSTRTDMAGLAAAASGGTLVQPVVDALGVERLDAVVRHRELLADLERLQRELTAGIAGGARQSATDTASLLNLFSLLPVQQEVPPPDGWAMEAQSLLALVAHVLGRPGPTTVVECGSGTSTVWLAYALRQRGGGRIVALEHDEEYATLTRDALARNGLTPWAEVRTAPLEKVEVGGSAHRWYAASSWRDLREVDLLVVDGPPGYVGRRGRYPAFPLLAPALSPGSVVVLDDAHRPGEAQVLERWTSEAPAGVSLRPGRLAGRSQFLEVSRADPGPVPQEASAEGERDQAS